MELLLQPEAWTAFATLTLLELVLGIDNIVFISILADKLPADQRTFARRTGLFLAMFIRISLLLLLSWIVGLTQPLFSILTQEFSGRDLILLAGGMFLIYKSTMEVHQLLEGEVEHASGRQAHSLRSVIIQIILIDAVFSLDSIITAVGLVSETAIMVSAIVCSVGLMMLFSEPIGRFVSSHPTVKMLALSFLFMIGMVLVADGFEHHVPKGYVYFAMAFSVAVEMLNLRLRKAKARPVDLHNPYTRAEG